MRDHPSAASVKVSVGAKNPQKPSRKPFTFGLPNEMRLIDIIKRIPASQHTPKSSLLDDANLAFQTQTQNSTPSQQTSALTLRSIGLGTAQLHLTFGFFFALVAKYTVCFYRKAN